MLNSKLIALAGVAAVVLQTGVCVPVMAEEGSGMFA